MERGFEQLIDFTLNREALPGKARIMRLSPEQWKTFTKEKTDLASLYELLQRKVKNSSAQWKEEKKPVDYYNSLVTSIKEPKKRFNAPELKQKFPLMSEICLINWDVDFLVLINPNEFHKLSLEKQEKAIVHELLHYLEHKTGVMYSYNQIEEKAEKIVEEFLSEDDAMGRSD